MMARRLRKFFFWCHLTAGCAAGIVSLLMSLTGVLLIYERQMLASAARSQQAPPPFGVAPRPFEKYVGVAAQWHRGTGEHFDVPRPRTAG